MKTRRNNVHKTLLLASYGWLTVFGVAHFLIDVIARRVHHRHRPHPTPALYYALHSTYSLGQVMFGSLALSIATSDTALLSHPSALLIAITAASGWLLIAWLFMDYWEPKAVAGIFFVLITAAAITR